MNFLRCSADLISPQEYQGKSRNLYLNLRHVSLLLTIANRQNLGVRNHSNNRAVLLQLFKLCLNALLSISVLLCIVDKGLLLTLVPTNLPGSRTQDPL